MTATASIPDGRHLTTSTRVWDGLLAVVTIASVAPLFSGQHLPFTDLPEHLAAACALLHFHDPAYRIAEHYELTFPGTPYVLFHVVLAATTSLLGDRAELAVRVLLAIAGVGVPLSIRRLCRALGSDPRLALFAPLVFWNRALVRPASRFATYTRTPSRAAWARRRCARRWRLCT